MFSYERSRSFVISIGLLLVIMVARLILIAKEKETF